jgi:hypothetical protein
VSAPNAGSVRPLADNAPAAQSGHATLSDSRGTAEFLYRALPWPGDDSPGFINCHWWVTGNDGKATFVNGLPVRTPEEFQALVTSLAGRRVDVYMALARQLETATKRGNVVAKRSKENSVALRALFLEIDVKPNGEKVYHTLEEAAAGFKAFIAASGMPLPSAIVQSGGGAHCYWFSERDLTRAEWLPYAEGLKELATRHGLKFDRGLTTDCARLLRVPGTMNYKYDPPRPVELVGMTGKQYNVSTDLAFLLGVAPGLPAIAPTKPAGPSNHNIEALRGKVPPLALRAIVDDLPPPGDIVDPHRIFAEGGCPLLQMAHATGGKEFSQGAWNLTTLAATFMANGNALAHRMARGYDGYSHEETEQLWARKNRERKKHGLGWPSCKAFSNESPVCTRCPHFGKISGPLALSTLNTVPVLPAREAPPIAPDAFDAGTAPHADANRALAIPQGATAEAPKYEPINREAPELAKLEPVWLTRIFDGDAYGECKGDGSRLAFTVTCELVRAGLNDDLIARVLMTTKCGAHVQEKPARRLPRILRRAREFAIDPDLEEMNRDHAVLPIGDKTRVVTWGADPDFPGRNSIVRAQTIADFKALHDNKRKTIIVPEVDDNGKATGKFKSKKVERGSWWIKQPNRRQYDGGRRFMPQHHAEVVGDVLNMYEGFPFKPRKPEGRTGASGCQLFLDHGFKVMCSANEEHYDYLIKREAWIAQHRRRSEIAAAYRTEAEGSGKGFWCNHLGHLYGPHFMQVNNPEHVIGKHNPHLETLLKLCADEALFVGNHQHRNVLFGLITERTINIEPKFVNVYTAPNYLNIDIISNARHFVPASGTARRFFIPTVSENRVGDLQYFNAIEAELRDGGYEALLYHLLYEVDLRDFDVRRVPKTAGLAEQAEYSRKGLDGLVEKVCNEGRVPCAHSSWPGFSQSNGYGVTQEGFDHFINNHSDPELRRLGDLKVKRLLRQDWGCVAGDDAKRRDGNSMVYGIKWPPLEELRQRFVERHGPQDWLHPEVPEWPSGGMVAANACS